MERLGWIENFDVVAQGRTAARPHAGFEFVDSEVYKLLEAMAWDFHRTGDPAADATFRALSDRIVAAQDADGYLNTCYGHDGQASRYSNLSLGHELYCLGHLLQAAVARLRTVGDDPLVEAARSAADHVCRRFGPEAPGGLCGHPEIEMGLAEFGRATGDIRYTEQAELFVRRRGFRTLPPPVLLGSDYFQDDVPLLSRTVWSGHAVRALYLAAGAVDIAVDLGDHALLEALDGQWHRTVSRRTYLTGGMGSRYADEGFGEDFELPTDRAYCETCAGIASIMVSWRLYLATGSVEFVDQIERTLHNVVAGAVSSEGNAFFYANTLHQRGEGTVTEPPSPRANSAFRAEWFDVACCPTNIARTLASLGSYSASVEDGRLALLQYATCEIRTEVGGAPVALAENTDYPHDGRIRIDVEEAPKQGVDLRLRIPSWAEGATILAEGPGVGDLRSSSPRRVDPGWVDLRAHAHDRLELLLPMSARATFPDPHIDAVRGCVAFERGPQVLCLESCDVPPPTDLEEILVDPSTVADRASGDVSVGAWGLPLPHAGSAAYGPAVPREPHPVGPVTLIPYSDRAERGTSAMRVFLPCSPSSEAS
jgi:DUF1680 family protein